MSNTNPIATLIATQTPIGTRYQLDPEPRHMGMCSNCHGDHHIQQCPEIARFDLTARLDEQSATIAALRLALDEAHQHVGALVYSGGKTTMQRYPTTPQGVVDAIQIVAAYLRDIGSAEAVIAPTGGASFHTERHADRILQGGGIKSVHNCARSWRTKSSARHEDAQRSNHTAPLSRTPPSAMPTSLTAGVRHNQTKK